MLQQSFYPALADNDYPATVEYQQLEPEMGIHWRESPTIWLEIDRLEEIILNSPRVPLAGKTMVNEEELLEQLDIVRSTLPDTIKTAQEILAYKNQIIREAQEQAQQILAEANRHAYQVANELGIIDRAEVEAREIRQMTIAECAEIRTQTMTEVERIRSQNVQEMERMRQLVMRECQTIQTGADEYADRVLSAMESQLADALQVIQRGRKQLNDSQPDYNARLAA